MKRRDGWEVQETVQVPREQDFYPHPETQSLWGGTGDCHRPLLLPSRSRKSQVPPSQVASDNEKKFLLFSSAKLAVPASCVQVDTDIKVTGAYI